MTGNSKTRILAHLQGIVEWRSGKDGEPVLSWVNNAELGSEGLALIQDEGWGTWAEISYSFQTAYATIDVRAYPQLAGVTIDVPKRDGLYPRWVSSKAQTAQLRAAKGWAPAHASFAHMNYGDQADCQALFSIVRQLCGAARDKLAVQFAEQAAAAVNHDRHIYCDARGCMLR